MNPSLEETIYLDFITSLPTGAAGDADSTPTAEVFEDATDVAMLSPTVTKRTGKTGDYYVPVACTAANGFEARKSYNVIASATIGGVAAKAKVGSFQIGPPPVTLANGPHGGAAATLRLGGSNSTPALYVTNSGGDATKFESTGGTGHGLHTATTNGHGIFASGGGDSGAGIFGSGNSAATGSAHGIIGVGYGAGACIGAVSNGSGSAFLAGADGTGIGMSIYGAANYGLSVVAVGANKHGITVTGGAAGDGIRAVGGSTGSGLNLLSGATGGHGLHASGVGAGIYAECAVGSNGPGIAAVGVGSGDGMLIAAGLTGHGLDVYTLGSGDACRFEAAGSGTAVRVQNYGSGKALWVVAPDNVSAGIITGNLSGTVGGVDVATAFSTVNNTLTVLSGYVDSEIATLVTSVGAGLNTLVTAIKAKTDLIPASPAAVSNVPTAAANAAALLDLAAGVETGLTLRQALRLMAAVLVGKTTDGGGVRRFRDLADTKDRVVAEAAAGDRTSVTLDLS